MKRPTAWILGGLVLGLAVYFGSRLGAVPAPATAPAQTRVALLNLRRLIKNYDKYQKFIEAMKKEEKIYIAEMQKLQEKVEALSKELQGLQGPQQEAKERELREVQREMEGVKSKATKALTEKSNVKTVEVYREARDAAARYAQANKFDIVFHYEGPADREEENNPDVVQTLVLRAISAGGTIPLYFNATLDITEPVLKSLNAGLQRSGK